MLPYEFQITIAVFPTEILDEDKPLYFPKGSFIDIAMKASTRPELQEVYRLAEKYNSYIELRGRWFVSCEILAAFKDIDKTLS